jgi:hypothetical protein
MDKDELINKWSTAAETGSLLTAKHDPNNLNITWANYRSVLSYDLSASLEKFIKSGEYSINHYGDTRYPKGSGYFEVIPNTGSTFSIPGSGVPAGSVTPTEAFDRLVIVHGKDLGWHAYSETSSYISASVTSGRLTLSASW